MAVVKVHFYGICTHFSRANHPQLPLARRVVLVNASAGAIVGGQEIAPHIATVRIDGPDIPIDGCTITLLAVSTPPAQSGVALTTGFGDVPSLTELVASRPDQVLSPPAGNVVFEADSTTAALWVDFDSGTLEAVRTDLDAVLTILTMEAEQIVLSAEPFPDAVLPQELSSPRTFNEDATIYIGNVDTVRETKSDDDFLLHYLTAATVPANPPLPTIQQLAQIPRESPPKTPIVLVGAGCSNSQYP